MVATTRAVRRTNMGLIVQTMLRQGPLSKAQIARITGLSKSSVGNLVAAINRIRPRPLIVEKSISRGKVGRPATVLVLDAGRVTVMGAAVYIDHIELVHVDLSGEVTERHQHNFPRATGGDLVRRLSEAVREEKSPQDIALGISCPGIIDAAAGTVMLALEFDWRELALSEAVQESLGLPCLLMNLSAAGAFDDSQTTGASSLLRVIVGTGVGAGLIHDGEVVTGHHHQAGEIGHITVKPEDGLLCRCGRTGCLEAEVSCDAVSARLQARGVPTVSDCGYEDLALAESIRPQEAAAVRGELAALLAQAFTVTIRLMDPEAIAIGGHITCLNPGVLHDIERELNLRRLGHAEMADVRFSLADPATGVARYALHRLASRLLLQPSLSVLQ